MDLNNVLCERPSKTIYRDGDKVIYLYKKDYSKGDILNAALNHARVEEVGIKLPRVHEVTKIGDRWAIVFDYIEGVTLEQMMQDDPSKTDEILDRFVQIQTGIHTFRCRKLVTTRNKMLDKISQADISENTRYELETRIEGMPRHEKLCHGDLMPSDIIITADGTPYILDWAHATQGNASADAGRTYMLFCLEGRQELGEKYLDKFCAASKISRTLVQRWLPILAASQSTKNIESQREFLMNWVNIAEYE